MKALEQQELKLAPCVLLVEGKDEVELIVAMLQHMQLSDKFCILNADGKGNLTGMNLTKSLKAITNRSEIDNVVRRIAVVKDADDHADGAFQSVRDAITKTQKLNAPQRPLELSDTADGVQTAVFIAPGPDAPTGMLETIVLKQLHAIWTCRMQCIDKLFDCKCEAADGDAPGDDRPPVVDPRVVVDKAKFKIALLLSYPTSEAPGAIHAIVKDGPLDFSAPAFSELRTFLHLLAEGV